MDNLPTHSSLASLVLISPWFIRLGLWSMIEQQVCIPQKTVRHTPTAKLLDAWLVMLAGGAGVVEANTRVRPDQALLGVFGRASCAEQSTISRTLSACTPTTVAQLRACLTHGLRQHGQAYAHDFQAREQLLDIDLTGLVTGRQAEGATKGYFAGQRSRRGRQLGRVLATHYAEVLVDQLYEGKRQLEHSFQPLVQAAEAVLDLTLCRPHAPGGDPLSKPTPQGGGAVALSRARHQCGRAHFGDVGRLGGRAPHWQVGGAVCL
jgi:hypothetical protein